LRKQKAFREDEWDSPVKEAEEGHAGTVLEDLNKKDNCYKFGLYNYTLLRSLEEVQDDLTDTHYLESQAKVEAENQVPFLKSQHLKLHEFIILRITGDTKVEEVKKFKKPYDPIYQALYFSEDTNFMLEFLENDRTFLYEWK